MKAINKFLKTLRQMPWMEWSVTGEQIRGVVVGGGDFEFCPVTAVHFARTGERALCSEIPLRSAGLSGPAIVAVVDAADAAYTQTREAARLRRRLLNACRLQAA